MESGDTPAEPDSRTPFTMVEVLGSRIHKIPSENTPSSIEEWVKYTQFFEVWGDVPVELISLDNRRQEIVIESSSGSYRAEFSQWPVSGMRARMRSENNRVDWPVGGLSIEGLDIALLWRDDSNSPDAEEVMLQHIASQDMDSATQLLERCGRALASAQEALSAQWTGPSDSRAWNSSITKLEEATKSRTLWRAPFKPGMPAMLSLGKTTLNRFSESREGVMRLRPPMCGPSDAASRSRDIEWPALRDLAALLYNIGEIAHGNVEDEDFENLRLAAIRGWSDYPGRRRTGGVKPHRALQVIGGGLPIWEYEQALSSKFDTSENSSPTSPRTDYMLRNIASIQRKLFTIRIFSAASLAGATSVFLGTIASILEPTQVSLTATAVGASVYIVMNGLYRYMAPKPESIFT
ncbi:MAG TPA: hypothetical protein D7H73_05205 [Candidatus Poseidoniales archaeon]|nr:MAG TPA: hypothetical protein D7H73_05205 [Candidatus Poseidoniales archaeon]